MRYWTQLRTQAGNFYDVLETDELERARSFAAYHRARGEGARVIRREDTVVIDEQDNPTGK